MKEFILVLFAAAFAGATVQGQGGDDLVKKSVAVWQKTRDSTHTIECEITIITTEIARKSTISIRILYPADTTTTMKASAQFDLDSGDFSVKLAGEKYDTAKQSKVPYSDQTVYFDKKLYGLLVPPKGKATGVGNGSGSGSDLAIVAGDLKSYP